MTATLVLFLAAFLAGGVLGVFATLVAGVMGSERRMGLHDQRDSRTGIATRRALGVYVRNDAPRCEKARR